MGRKSWYYVSVVVGIVECAMQTDRPIHPLEATRLRRVPQLERWADVTHVMRIISAFIFLAALPIAHAGTNAVTITGLQDGKRTAFTPEICDQIATLSVELLQTTTIEAGNSVATEERFKEAEQTSHLHLT